MSRRLKQKDNLAPTGGNPAAAVLEKDEIIRQAKRALSLFPDVRQDKIQKALERIARGYYERPEVRAKIADRLLDEMGIG